MGTNNKTFRIECFLKAAPYIENINDNIIYLISERLSISQSRLSQLIRKRFENSIIFGNYEKQ